MEKCVVITGAAGGIGQALVQAFSDAGYHVIGLDRESCPEGVFCNEYVRADLNKFVEDTVYAKQVAKEIKTAARGKGISVLVNNAAVQILGGVNELARDDWRKTLNVNLQAPFLLTQALIAELEASHGCVLNISSIHARLTKAGFVAYATSKAALSGMTRAMAVDLGGRIRVNAIEPAAIETEMLMAGFAGNQEGYRRLRDLHPQNRIGTPKEVAAMSVWLTSEDARFVHGACVAIDGAIGARLYDPT